MDTPYQPASYKADGFNCPFCHYYSEQEWSHYVQHGSNPPRQFKDASVCICKKCKRESLWYRGELIVPRVAIAPMPHSDMPYDLRADYEEATWIVNDSPRGAAALLRLVIQKLMVKLGEKGDNLNSDIASLVKKGLRADIRQALDAVRVIGNNAVHPGEMNLTDNRTTAMGLFNLVNIIIRDQITQPRQVQRVYDSLPDDAKKSVEKRDKS